MVFKKSFLYKSDNAHCSASNISPITFHITVFFSTRWLTFSPVAAGRASGKKGLPGVDGSKTLTRGTGKKTGHPLNKSRDRFTQCIAWPVFYLFIHGNGGIFFLFIIIINVRALAAKGDCLNKDGGQQNVNKFSCKQGNQILLLCCLRQRFDISLQYIRLEI